MSKIKTNSRKPRVKPQVLTALRDQVRIVLSDYKTCKFDYQSASQAWHLEGEFKYEAISEEIAKRMIDNYMFLSKAKVRPVEAQAAIAQYIASEALVDKDPWAVCRGETKRILVEGDIIRIVEKMA